ncbi:hypothetical protein ABS71_00730 [bacterium SCN 62-11]|nr:MAG: hypothetical protein ABS71_00730 [bacterium SCN 62-11]
MNCLGSLQSINGPGATLEGLPSGAPYGLSGLAQDRCGVGGPAFGEVGYPLSASSSLFQQSLISLSTLLLQLLQPAVSSALPGVDVGKGAKSAPVDKAAGRSSGRSSKGSSASKDSNGSRGPGGSGVGSGSGPVTGRPNGYNEIVSQFGQPGDRSNIISVPMKAGPGGRTVPVQVHKKIADRLKKTFDEINAAGLSDEIKTFDGSYNARKKRGGSTWSVHSWGLAIDLNAGQYPMGTSASATSPRFKQIAQIFARNGFYQLGSDPMHFQFATGY